MPIKIQAVPDVYAPLIFCDHCGERITEARQGQVLFIPPDLFAHPEIAQLFPDNKTQPHFVHIKCVRDFDKEHFMPDGGRMFWMPLNDFLVHLNHNCHAADESKMIPL